MHFFIDITNIFVNMTDFSCHYNQKDTLRIANECLCVILTYYFLLCSELSYNNTVCFSMKPSSTLYMNHHT